MDHSGGGVLACDIAEKLEVLEASVKVLDSRREVVFMLAAVQDGRFVAAFDELGHDVGPAETGAADHEDSHLLSILTQAGVAG
jgi:hypothetical protein